MSRRSFLKVSDALSSGTSFAHSPAATVPTSLENNSFESDFQQSYWGPNDARLARIKHPHDPDGLFFVRNGIGSGQCSPDGFTRR